MGHETVVHERSGTERHEVHVIVKYLGVACISSHGLGKEIRVFDLAGTSIRRSLSQVARRVMTSRPPGGKILLKRSSQDLPYATSIQLLSVNVAHSIAG
jgi:hypothetical protein